MTEFESVKLAVQGIKYKDDITFIRDLLSAFRIPLTTISRVLGRMSSNYGLKTAELYSRAKISISDVRLNTEQEEALFHANLNFPLYVLVSSGQVSVFDSRKYSITRFHADESSGNLLSLLKLASAEKVLVSTDPRGVAELSAELFNILTGVELGNTSSASAAFIINLNYLSFIISRFGRKNLKELYTLANTFNETDFNKVLYELLGALTSESSSQFALQSVANFSFMKGSFEDIPRLTSAAAELTIRILDCDLSNVDAEALSSLLYKVINPEEKGLYGYKTSLGNANKVLGPIYFDKLRQDIEAANGDKTKLARISESLESVVFFDPTDGPGSFLSLAISKAFELAALIRDESEGCLSPELAPGQFIGTASNNLTARSAHMCIFSTFALAKYAHHGLEIAEAEDLYKSVKVVVCDQISTPWEQVCPNDGNTIIVGCPIFKGFKKLPSEDKNRMINALGHSNCGDLDFSATWVVLGARYISKTNSKAAFVLTNSICQGVQVGQVWPTVFEENVGINFAHTSFKWINGPDQSSAVTVVIVGLASDFQCEHNQIFSENKHEVVEIIGPYLTSGNRIIIRKRRKRISQFMPPMVKGNMPYDNENLLLTNEEKQFICNEYPQASILFKKALGSKEYIRRIPRWCLWIPNQMIELAQSIPPIAHRISLVKQWRESSSDKTVIKFASRAHQFRELNETKKQSLIIPSVSSERRLYIPMGFVGPDTIITNLAFAIYDCEPWVMGVLSSKMHMSWVRTVCGSLETRLRYSSELGYNTFPFLEIDDSKKQVIKSIIFDIIKERENYPELDLGSLYTKMPDKLKELHDKLDFFIDSCYSSTPFDSDVDRVALLFKLYKINNE